MKKICFAFLFFCSTALSAQVTADSLINEAVNKMKNGINVSQILTDKRYLSIHPATYFREMIKSYTGTGVLRITTSDEPGKKIRVIGSVRNDQGQAIAGALVYLYQTDSKGWYAADAPHVSSNAGDMNHARLFGYIKTDPNGKFELNTIKPSGYPSSDLPAHIHVHVWAEGYNTFVNEFLFDDDVRLVGKIRQQSVRNQFIISKPEKTVAPFDQQFSYQVVLTR